MSAVVHEAFVQRQHTRYRLPLLVTFAGQTYKAIDWSVGGLGLEGVDLDIGVGTIHPLDLLFAFQGFTLTVRVDAEIRHVNRAQRRVGFRFMDVTVQQLSLIQFVIDAMKPHAADLGLLWDDTATWGSAERAMDAVHDRFGAAAVAPASMLRRERKRADLGPSGGD